MKSILVTGGAGFIGSHACKALARAGYLPITIDNLEIGHLWAIKWGPFEHADIRNELDLRRVFEKWTPWAVIHFAAYAYVGESVENPIRYYENNIGGTAKLLAACVEFNCKNVVFSSSCATYGIPTSLPLTEAHRQRPVNPYGYSKLVVEQMLRDVEVAHGVRHIALRYFNASGADPEGELGEVHEPETHLIPLVLFAALGWRNAVKIYGTDYPTQDGTCIRDFIHVADLADAHVLAINWLEQGKASDCFNLGNGQGFSVKEVIKLAQDVTGALIKTELLPRRAGDPAMLTSDSSKAKKILKWRPKYPGLEKQIDHAWNWFRDEMPNFKTKY